MARTLRHSVRPRGPMPSGGGGGADGAGTSVPPTTRKDGPAAGALAAVFLRGAADDVLASSAAGFATLAAGLAGACFTGVFFTGLVGALGFLGSVMVLPS